MLVQRFDHGIEQQHSGWGCPKAFGVLLEKPEADQMFDCPVGNRESSQGLLRRAVNAGPQTKAHEEMLARPVAP